MIIWRNAHSLLVAALAVSLVLVPALASAPAIAQSSASTGATVEIVEFGTYVVTGRINGQPTANGQRNYFGSHDLLMRTDQICTRLNTTFGIEYQITTAESSRPGDVTMLTVVTKFPPEGLVNGQGVKFADNTQTSPVIAGVRQIRSFTFDEPFEMVTGIWTFEIRHQDHAVATKSFFMRNCDPTS
jgi:Domain of unknown function (DUF3859)